MSGKKQHYPKMPKKYGKHLKRMSMSEEEKEEITDAIVDEDLATSIFK